MVKHISKIKYKSFVKLTLILSIIIILNIFSSFVFKRIDLTAEKRYTLTDYSKKTLKELDGQIFVKIYLDGDYLPLHFKKFRNSIKEILDIFGVYSKQNLNYEFINPVNPDYTQEQQDNLMKELYYLGITPVQDLQLETGQATNSQIFPAVVISYTFYDNETDSLFTRSVGVNLLNNDPNFEQSSPENINNSIQTLEYKLINEIKKITQRIYPKVVFLEGHGELPEPFVVQMERILSEYYDVMRGQIGGIYGALDKFDLVIIAKPTKPFSEEDKFVLDQYIMKGGKVLWLLDGVDVSMDSIFNFERAFAMPALPQVIKIDDQLFTYGVRINTDILQDLFCSSIMLKGVSVTGEERNHWYNWLYFPLIATKNNHVINKYVDLLKTEFVSSIDTVGKNPKIKKTILLSTSNQTFKIGVNMPLQIDFNEINNQPQQNLFKQKDIPIAMLLEGEFPSLFKGRIVGKYMPNANLFLEKSESTKMIVISDGDLIKNVVKSNGEVMPMEFDKYSLYNFEGSKQFLLNCVNYLCDDEGLMSIRAREFKLRLLDKKVTENQKLLWQTINVLLPILVIILIGLTIHFIRIKKYSKKS